MKDKLNTQVELIRQLINDEAEGFETRVLSFVREFSIDQSVENRIIKLNFQYSRLSDEEVESKKNQFKQQYFDVLESVIEGYSPPKISEYRSQLLSRTVSFSEAYSKRKELVFSCDQLEKKYDENFQFGPIDLSINKGEIYGVVGENGNGKTTLFELIVGKINRTGGVLKYGKLESLKNNKVPWKKVKEKIAYVPQELPKWYGNLKDNLHYEAGIHGVLGERNTRNVDFIISRLDLGNHIHKDWSELSGGFKFRFALAKALVWEPDLIILDEPLANLDVVAQQVILSDITHLCRNITNPIAIFISSQHLHEIEAVSDKILFLRDGQSIYNGPPGRIGLNRISNKFELICNEDIEIIRKTLENSGLQACLKKDAMGQITINTALYNSPKKLLETLIDANIVPVYFRDISQSTKAMFKFKAA